MGAAASKPVSRAGSVVVWVARFLVQQPVALARLVARIVLWMWGFKSFDWGGGIDAAGLVAHARQAGVGRATALLLWRVLGLVLRAFKFITAPDVVVRQLISVIILQTGFEGARWCWRAAQDRLGTRFGLARHRASLDALYARLRRARNYQEWKAAAQLLDSAEGKDEWKHNNVSEYFDYRHLQSNMVKYMDLQRRGDAARLMWHLRAELHRKTFGLANPELHSVCRVGSKQIIEHYMQTVASALDYVCDVNAEAEPRESILAKLEFFNETRHAYGKSALLLSGGATMGLYHLGVIQALLKEGLLPRVISGSSAGSIITAVIGTRTDEELRTVLEKGTMDLTFFGVRSTSEVESSDSWFARCWRSVRVALPMPVQIAVNEVGRIVPRWIKSRTLLDIDVLAESLKRNIGEMTFAEAFVKTNRIINITVAPAGSYNMPMLLNYLTAPHVLIWTAAAASCAIPGVFAPVDLLAKDEDGNVVPYLSSGIKWSDGSVAMDLPIARLSELFNVNMFVVSQVNPHARLFTGLELGNGVFAKAIQFLKREVRGYVENLSDVGLMMPLVKTAGRWLVPVLTQRYEGDVTIVPPFALRDVTKLLTNPTRKAFYRYIDIGERCTWEKIPRLYTRCLVEFTLDECVRRLRARLAVPREAGLGRVPSFHTSTSGGALHGLDASRHADAAAALSDIADTSGRGAAAGAILSGSESGASAAGSLSPASGGESDGVVRGLYRSARTRGSHVRFGSALDLSGLDVAGMGVDLTALSQRGGSTPQNRRRRHSSAAVVATP
eukprot:CAMPEP_0203813622 /NCGR_PEP_ID=MMETSP0115-20131106/4822_1 /ASSEMBLY_ACC=CAM_ASM_000227 /TAXON_ID=33651 /ORGANISM="Bicosoecid sp, Strain ms1" /LENGTH=782 /DNA_ID=CAMNT_0050722497 /DNA_START=139 /DNA_END=2484 /DNA_ORIENTATION=+